ncbi:hypothetical protein EI94DRAFT_1751039, partial [Lactarius quietus]
SYTPILPTHSLFAFISSSLLLSPVDPPRLSPSLHPDKTVLFKIPHPWPTTFMPVDPDSLADISSCSLSRAQVRPYIYLLFLTLSLDF